MGFGVSKSYNQYCPIATALDLVGERWSLLIVRELLEDGELRYSDLHARLTGCGTNILAARLKQLEAGGVITRRRLPPPAAATVYELTEYGLGLRAVMHQLAHWGARMMPVPTSGDLEPGWLHGALPMAFPPTAPASRVEFRIGDEVASLVDGAVFPEGVEDPDAVVIGGPRRASTTSSSTAISPLSRSSVTRRSSRRCSKRSRRVPPRSPCRRRTRRSATARRSRPGARSYRGCRRRPVPPTGTWSR